MDFFSGDFFEFQSLFNVTTAFLLGVFVFYFFSNTEKDGAAHKKEGDTLRNRISCLEHYIASLNDTDGGVGSETPQFSKAAAPDIVNKREYLRE